LEVNSQVPQGPGRGPRDGDRGGRGRDGRPGGKGRRDERAPSSGGQRVVVELSALEKALGKGDFEAQVRPLDEVVRQLRTLRVRTLAELEPNARGRLITTLLRVSRQPKPAGEPAPTEDTAAPKAPTAEAPEPADVESPPPAVEVSADDVVTASGEEEPAAQEETAEAPSSETEAKQAIPQEAEASEEASPQGAPPSRAPVQLHSDVLYRVGLAWLAVHEADRAETAFGAAGRTPSTDELANAEASAPKPETARGTQASRKPGPERKKPTRGPRERPSLAPMPPIAPGDWRAQAEAYASRGRTRDAARLHEKHGAPADALKLYEAGGDAKGALRAALAAKDMEAARRLAQALPAAEARSQLERAEAWELLMELLVKGNAFDDVAKLYERARQFDQAALAWERAGKLGLARKAYERARDPAGAERARSLEVQRLVERGDRLGAAQVLVQSNRRAEAVEVLKTLPATKAFRFLEQLKLKDEARALGEAELTVAKAEGKPGPQARWLDLLGRKAEAAQAWEEGGRKDRAYPLLETLGDFAKAAAFAEASGHRDQAIRLYRRAGDDRAAERLEATPPSTPPPPPAEDAHIDDTGAPEAETGSNTTPTPAD
jgi:tetratricopeptide (TPR) repeat protein